MTAVAEKAERTSTYGDRLALATLLPLIAVPLVLIGEGSGVLLWLIALTAAPHVAGGFAFYFDRDAQPVLASDPVRFYVVPLVLIASFAMFGAAAQQLDPRVPASAVAAFFVWQFHHFSRQNYGVLSLCFRSWQDDSATPREARLVRLGGVASMVGGLRAVRLVFGPMLVPDRLVDVAFVVGLLLMAVALVELAALRGSGRRWWLLVGVTVFHLPLFVVADGATAIALHAIAHPIQYGLILWSLRGGREAEGPARFTTVLAVLAVGGAWLLDRAADSGPFVGALAGAAFGVVAWHFVLDAGVWRLSKPEPRAYMRRRFAWL